MYIYGKNVLKEKINNREEIKKIYLADNFNDQEILKLINGYNVERIPNFKLDKLVDGNHQGVVIHVDDYRYFDLSYLKKIERDDALILILDHLEDPHNFGAIIRTSEALGVDAIIIPNKRSVEVNSTVIKTSVGAISYLPIIQVSNLVNAINHLKDNGYWIVGSDMNKSDYNDFDYKRKLAIVIGNEGKGMSDIVSKNCDDIVSIPMKGRINSLNASVAAALLIAKAVDKR